jgi:hypothetical protein
MNKLGKFINNITTPLLKGKMPSGLKEMKPDRNDVMTNILTGINFSGAKRQKVAEKEIPYDFACSCINCGELMPKANVETAFGRCSRCATRRFEEDTKKWFNKLISLAVAAFFLVTITILIFRVGLKEHIAAWQEILFIGQLFKGHAEFAVSAMIFLYAPLVRLLSEKLPDKIQYIRFVVVLAYIALTMCMFNSYIIVILLDIILWLGVFGILGYRLYELKLRNEVLLRYRQQTVEFQTKIYRLENGIIETSSPVEKTEVVENAISANIDLKQNETEKAVESKVAVPLQKPKTKRTVAPITIAKDIVEEPKPQKNNQKKSAEPEMFGYYKVLEIEQKEKTAEAVIVVEKEKGESVADFENFII